MKWFGNPARHGATELEDLAYPPDGGKVKLILLGILLPTVIFYFAGRAWITGEAVWFGRGNHDMEIYGAAARSMAVVYASAGAFCHFRWFWGILPNYSVYEIGTVLSAIGILGGFGFAFYHQFF